MGREVVRSAGCERGRVGLRSWLGGRRAWWPAVPSAGRQGGALGPAVARPVWVSGRSGGSGLWDRCHGSGTLVHGRRRGSGGRGRRGPGRCRVVQGSRGQGGPRGGRGGLAGVGRGALGGGRGGRLVPGRRLALRASALKGCGRGLRHGGRGRGSSARGSRGRGACRGRGGGGPRTLGSRGGGRDRSVGALYVALAFDGRRRLVLSRRGARWVAAEEGRRRGLR